MATNLTNDPVPFTSREEGDQNHWEVPLDAWVTAVSVDLTAVRNTADSAVTAAATAQSAATAAAGNTVAPSRIADGSLPLTKLAATVATAADLAAVTTTANNAAASAAAAATAATAVPVLTPVSIPGAYTLALSDSDKLLRSASATPVAYTIPTNAAVAIPVGRSIRGTQNAAGQITFTWDTGTVVVKSLGNLKTTAGQNAQWEAIKTGTNEWLLGGEFV